MSSGGSCSERSISENLAEIQENIGSMERTWWRYGLPSIILAWFGIGVVVGVLIGVFIA